MRFVLTVLTVLVPMTAAAASLEQSYYASRAAHIKEFQNPGDLDDARLKQHQLALADLEKKLRPIVGPSEFKDVGAEGKINLDTLSRTIRASAC